MKHVLVVVMAVGAIALAGCAAKKKVQIEYDDPVTRVWSGGDATPPPAPADAGAAQGAPPSAYPGAPSVTYGAPAQQQYGAPPQGQYPPPAPYPGPAPYPTATPYPPPAPYPQQGQYPPPAPYPPAQAQPQPGRAQVPPGGSWQTPGAPPTVVNDPSTATTVVIPDQNPTTQTTLKRRTGWVRGGYD